MQRHPCVWPPHQIPGVQQNINADAVIAVYPFTPQAGITQAIIGVSDVPVFVGVGGGLTNGQRSAQIAAFAEHQGAFGVVCNTFMDEDTIRATIQAGANAITYSPPSNGQLFAKDMHRYRQWYVENGGEDE